MKRKNTFYMLLLLPILSSCSMNSKVQKMIDISHDISDAFGHNSVSSYYHWKNHMDSTTYYVEIAFYKFDVDSKSHEELEELAKEIELFFWENNTDFGNIDEFKVKFKEGGMSSDESEASFNFVY